MQGAGHSRILRVLELSAVVPFARPELQQLFATFSPRSNGPFKEDLPELDVSGLTVAQ